MTIYDEITWSEENIARFWDYYSQQSSPVYFSQMYGEAVIRFIKWKIPLQGTIVDLGCGPGYLTDRLLQFASSCIAIDSSKESLELARVRLQHHIERVRIAHSRVDSTPLDDAEADVVFLLEVLEHLDEELSSRVFAELRRLTKVGGYVVITVPNEESLESGKIACPECGCIFHRMQHQRSFSADSLTRTLEAEGFIPVISRSLNFDDYIGGTMSRGIGLLRRLSRPYRRPNAKLRHLVAVGQYRER